jgi:hypothetical protein
MLVYRLHIDPEKFSSTLKVSSFLYFCYLYYSANFPLSKTSDTILILMPNMPNIKSSIVPAACKY